MKKHKEIIKKMTKEFVLNSHTQVFFKVKTPEERISGTINTDGTVVIKVLHGQERKYNTIKEMLINEEYIANNLNNIDGFTSEYTNNTEKKLSEWLIEVKLFEDEEDELFERRLDELLKEKVDNLDKLIEDRTDNLFKRKLAKLDKLIEEKANELLERKLNELGIQKQVVSKQKEEEIYQVIIPDIFKRYSYNNNKIDRYLNVLNIKRVLLFIGPAGSGKTELIQYLIHRDDETATCSDRVVNLQFNPATPYCNTVDRFQGS